MNQKQILILSGTARSGTSALTNFLNSHSSICLGMERFKFQMLQNDCFSPQLFTQERFFDFQEKDTNVLPKFRPKLGEYYAALEKKFPEAACVGDKIPNLAPKLEKISNSIPEAKFVYIIRHVSDVASSWDLRAENDKDAWPKEFNYLAAAKKWTQHNSLLEELICSASGKNRIHIVKYEDFFSGNEIALKQLMAFLQLNIERQVERKFLQLVKYYHENVKTKVNSLTEKKLEDIDNITDYNLYEKLIHQG